MNKIWFERLRGTFPFCLGTNNDRKERGWKWPIVSVNIQTWFKTCGGNDSAIRNIHNSYHRWTLLYLEFFQPHHSFQFPCNAPSSRFIWPRRQFHDTSVSEQNDSVYLWNAIKVSIAAFFYCVRQLFLSVEFRVLFEIVLLEDLVRFGNPIFPDDSYFHSVR